MNRAVVLITVILLIAFGVAAYAPAQTATGAAIKDPTAVRLASNALKAMTSGVAVNDFTLSADVVRTLGPDSESGEATLQALTGGDASLKYLLSTERQAEIINSSSEQRGAWSGADGLWHRIPLHNTWTPAAWFAPVLVLEAALDDSQLTLENLGAATFDGKKVEHLRFCRILPMQSGSPATLALIKNLSTVDIFLDAASNLPVALDFNLHPDSNAGVNIPVEIRYSNWQKSSGTLIPFRIQKLLNGSLLDDISVSSVAVNSGLSSSSFTVPAVSGGAQ